MKNQTGYFSKASMKYDFAEEKSNPQFNATKQLKRLLLTPPNFINSAAHFFLKQLSKVTFLTIKISCFTRITSFHGQSIYINFTAWNKFYDFHLAGCYQNNTLH